MITQTKWIDRKFDFDFPIGLFPNIVERLRGTPVRLDELVRKVPPDKLTKRPGDKWSIQEHIGHLIDVESLWLGRLDDFLSGTETLRPADMTNRKTFDTDHNSADIQDILISFRSVRMDFVKRLEELDDATVARPALHPRLNKPMRPADMAFFAAEHDDHHIAIITRLVRKL